MASLSADICGLLNQMQCFSTSPQTTTREALKLADHACGAVKAGNRTIEVVAAGGHASGSIADVVEIYNVTSKTWRVVCKYQRTFSIH